MVRPAKQPEDRRDIILKIRLTVGERQQLERSAGSCELSTWARWELLKIAQRAEKKAGRASKAKRGQVK